MSQSSCGFCSCSSTCLSNCCSCCVNNACQSSEVRPGGWFASLVNLVPWFRSTSPSLLWSPSTLRRPLRPPVLQHHFSKHTTHCWNRDWRRHHRWCPPVVAALPLREDASVEGSCRPPRGTVTASPLRATPPHQACVKSNIVALGRDQHARPELALEACLHFLQLGGVVFASPRSGS